MPISFCIYFGEKGHIRYLIWVTTDDVLFAFKMGKKFEFDDIFSESFLFPAKTWNVWSDLECL